MPHCIAQFMMDAQPITALIWMIWAFLAGLGLGVQYVHAYHRHLSIYLQLLRLLISEQITPLRPQLIQMEYRHLEFWLPLR
ncbi:MAG: hypothetical protein A3J42_06910 [Candidatus Dadabacteria bacterium RIFCSPHIGHO2_12_FULL_53_21]|nr:MAG: hypothetical protein A3J42_06910 [Candidatus Dadabacteria bacterium RIFCSPHIGHO2_12_FULL_53_21]